MTPLWLQVLRDGKWLRTLRVDDGPFTLGGDAGCDATLDGPGVPATLATVLRDEGGEWVLELPGDPLPVPLFPGVQRSLGAFALAVADPPPGGGGGDDAAPGGLLDSLLDLLADLRHEDDDRARMEALLRALVAGFGAEWGALMADEGGTKRIVATHGVRNEAPSDQVSSTVLNQLDATADPVLATDVAGSTPLMEAKSIPADVRSVIAAKLATSERNEGTVYLESSATRAPFTAAERNTLERVCAMVAETMAAERRASELAETNVRLGEAHRLAVHQGFDLDHMVGEGPAMQEVFSQIRKAAEAGVTTLILGESGTGKDLVARAIHNLSARKRGPFVALNCAAVTPTLAESQLFGHKKGAFTGATADRAGRLELAHRGVLFLDELGELGLETQAKLLRALEGRRIQRLGEDRERPVDIQLVAATNANLDAAMDAGRFREDLYYRVAVFMIRLPPLRERRDDLPALVSYFLQRISQRYRRRFKGVTREAMAALGKHDWPGNVRELRNVIEQAVVRESGAWIGPDSFTLSGVRGPSAPPPAAPIEPFEEARERWEREYLTRCLKESTGSVTEVMEKLGMSRTSFYRRCRALGIDTGASQR